MCRSCTPWLVTGRPWASARCAIFMKGVMPPAGGEVGLREIDARRPQSAPRTPRACGGSRPPPAAPCRARADGRSPRCCRARWALPARPGRRGCSRVMARAAWSTRQASFASAISSISSGRRLRIASTAGDVLGEGRAAEPHLDRAEALLDARHAAFQQPLHGKIQVDVGRRRHGPRDWRRPAAVQSGVPSRLPFRSQSATSTAAIAKATGPPRPA